MIQSVGMHRHDDRGFTLVELMVAATLGLVIVTIVFQLFTVQVRNFRESRMTAEMQQELRWAMNYMADRLRLAGNGVPPTSGFSVLDNNDNVSAGSDSVSVIASYKSLVTHTTQNMANEGSQVKVSSADNIDQYDLIVISYPPNGWQEIFLATKIASDLHIYHDAFPPWNDDNKLNHRYPVGSICTVVTNYSFYVEVDGDGIPNLMVLTQGPYGPQELAGNIESFQIRFRLRDDNWVSEADNFTDIRMIEIVLRARSPEPIPGYIDPDYDDGYKRLEMKTIVIPNNIVFNAT